MKKTRHFIKRKIQKVRRALLRTRAKRPVLFIALIALAFSFGGFIVWGGVTITRSINPPGLESGLALHYTFDDGDVSNETGSLTVQEYGEFSGLTTLASPVGEGNANHGPYIAHDRQWIFFSNGAGGFVYKTKDIQGGTWSSETSLSPSPIGQGRYFNITFDGTYFHVLYRVSGDARYIRYTPHADGTVTADSSQTAYSDATWDMHSTSMYITTDYQGRPWIQFQVTDGTNYKPVVSSSTATDGTWSTRSGFPYDLDSTSTSSNHGLYPGIVELGNDEMIFTWRDTINDRVSARVWDNSVWGSVEDTGLAQASYGRTSSIYAGSGEVLVNGFTDVAHRATNGTWSDRSPGGMNTSSMNSFSKAGNTIRLWDNNGGDDIRYKETSDAGLTWGTVTTFATATASLDDLSASSEVDAEYHTITWATGANPHVRFAGVDGELPFGSRLGALTDRSSNGNDGATEGGIESEAGRIGQAARLNGTDGYISSGDIGSNIRSVSFWMKTDALGGGGGLISFNGSQSISVKPDAGANWYNSSWSHRKQIFVQSSQVEETVTNFPVLIQTTDANWKSTSNGGNVGQTSGNDILFTTSSGVKLDHEIEKYDPTTGELIAWVKVPTLSSSADTELYIYYGNSGAADQQNATGVWDSNYAGVWHLKENPAGTAPQMLDSTTNTNAGTSNGTMTSGDQVSGQVDGSLDLDGTDDVIRVPNSTSTNITGDEFTLSAWVYPTGLGCGSSDCDEGVISKAHESASNLERYHLGIKNTGEVVVRRFSGSQNFGPTTQALVVNNEWQYITGRYDGATLKAYYNGNEAGSTAATGNITSSTEDLLFGKRDSARFYEGKIDEARVSNIARSNGWIATEYNNQSSPSTFYDVGVEESYGMSDVDVNGLTSPTVYIDGSSANTTLTPNSWHHITITTSTNINANNVEIGRVGSNYFNGTIDDLRIFDTTLSTSDVDRLYHLGATTRINTSFNPPELQVGLTGYWTFDGSDSDNDLNILFVVGASPVNSSDQYLYDIMTLDMEASVTVRLASAAAPTLTSYDVVVISETSLSSDVVGKYSNASIGVVNLENASWDENDLAAFNANVTATTDAVITASHPITTGYSGTTTILSTAAQMRGATTSNVAASADYLLNVVGNSSFLIAFAYEKGATLLNSHVAEARRVALGFHSDTYSVFAQPAEDIFKTSIRWASSGDLVDLSGNGNHGTYITGSAGAGGAVAGSIGQGIKFSGVTDNIAIIPDDDSLDIGSGSFTYGAWIKADAFVGGYDMPMYKGGASAGDTGWDMELGADSWGAGISDGSMVRIVFFNDNDYSPPYLNAGEWYHLLAVVDRSNDEFRSYRNGVLINTTSITGFGTSNSTDDLTFGGRPGGSPNLFDGTIDDLRVYNRALPADEIDRLYHLGATTKVNTTLPASGSLGGPIAHWTFDGPTISGSTVEDVAGTFDGSITGTTPEPGIIGQALSFDGVGDYVQISDDPSIRLGTSDFTYSLRVKSNEVTNGSTTLTDAFLSMTAVGGFKIIPRENGSIKVEIGDATTDTTAAMERGAWSTWTFVGTGGTSVAIYKDGVFSNSYSTNYDINYTSGLTIGAQLGGTGMFNGTIDDVRIYDRALSADEIDRIASQAPSSGGSFGVTTPFAPAPTGNITIERWYNINGTGQISDIPLGTTPDYAGTVSTMESTFTNGADDYGQRIRGYIYPETTGNYTFWLASDDDGELNLSTDHTETNKTTIASHAAYTSSREWDKYTTQQSVPIYLEAGKRYYIEALQADGGGGDNLAVAWKLDDTTDPTNGSADDIIPGSVLSEWE